MREYRQLTEENYIKIHAMKQAEKEQNKIAERIKFDKEDVSMLKEQKKLQRQDECDRNSDAGCFDPNSGWQNASDATLHGGRTGT